MQVVDHDPHAWFLFKSEDNLLLDINCNHSAVGHSVLILLTPEETSNYAREGHAYFDQLAQRVHNSGPGSAQQGRNVAAKYGRECHEAFKR